MRRPATPKRPWLGKSALLGIATLAAFGAWWWVEAEAQVREQMLGLGPQLLSLAPGPGPRTMRLNDQRLRLAQAATGAAVPEVIARARAECRSREIDLDAWASTASGVAEDDETILAWNDERRGFVGCLGRGSLGAEQLGDDLAGAGGFRYLYAERRGETTHVAAVESVGSFVLARVMPPEGDASGHDLAGIPRPPGSRRVLSAEIEGEPYRARFYEGALEPERVRAHYRRELSRNGWRVVTRDDALTVQATGARGFVVVSPDVQRGRTYTLVVQSDERMPLGTPP